MIIMTLEKVPKALRGELTRWLLEVSTGVYIGHVSARVRDLLWDKCVDRKQTGRVFQAWSTNNEQHFNMRMSGSLVRRVVDHEGMMLVEELKEDLTAAQTSRILREELTQAREAGEGEEEVG
jgi:CRISPR-associated protein Cas2